ncbi:MAG: TRAFAC clade GTPase domain-containing protein [Syntrophobacteraceae bacterium]
MAETGKCVEGFDLSECPNLRAAAVPKAPEPIVEDDESVTEPVRADVHVGGGEILTIDEAAGVLRNGPTRVLTLIGPQDSGKTTLGVSLYATFQNGPFEHLSFAGSMTLVSFEQRIHLAQAACGKDRPDTPRTSRREGLGFLHFALHDEKMGRVDLLISERSGEFYKDVADSKEDCKDLYEIDRADLIIFLVDGEKLATDEHHAVKSDTVMMVETLVEGGILKKMHRVGIVLTKYDLVLSSGLSDRVKKDFDTLVENIRSRIGPKISEIHAFIIAARPVNDEVPPLFGVLGVIDECLRPRQWIRFVPPSRVPVEGRWFCRLQPVAGSA